ncbi:MAG: hypothetical protein WD512_11070 [Candidatus Paceibacterota bacterium]
MSKIAGRISQLIEKKEEILLSVVDDEAIEILQDRLEDGKRADGNSFAPYSDVTIDIKRSTGGFISSSGNIALKDTGGFYRSMELRKEKKFVEVTSNDSIANDLFDAFGDDILDLSVDENNEVFERKREEYIKEIDKFIFQ